MTISHSYKCIFIHVPKCGGTSINNIIDPSQTKPSCNCRRGQIVNKHDHTSAESIKNTNGQVFDSYYKFAFVRNPYDKLVSEYYWAGKDKILTFEKFIYTLESSVRRGELHYKQQYKFLCDANNKLLIPESNIFKYENYEQNIKTLQDTLKIDKEIKKFNSNKHESYDKYFTPRLYEIVNQLYAKDFEMFGYTMNH
jgi:chondroitin 4-sulfotransferase 11